MAEVGLDYLNETISRIVADRARDLVNRQPLIFLDRVPSVPADETDILGKFSGKTFAADIINRDQGAVVYDAGKFEFVTNTIPKIKMGSYLPESLLRLLDRINRGARLPEDEGLLGSSFLKLATSLVVGVRQRVNALICAMWLDSHTYDRFGVKITGSWGKPADLKVTPAVAWTNVATAKPVKDILDLNRYAIDTYGRGYRRVTMATADFNDLLATDEYANRYRGLFRFDFPAGTIDTENRDNNRNVLGRMLNMEVELHDTTYKVRNADGTETSTRVQPLKKVILSDPADDGNTQTWDLANGVVTESLVASLAGSLVPSALAGAKRGPVAYVTLSNPNLNPPGAVAWAVQECFPRLHDETATAVLTVG